MTAEKATAGLMNLGTDPVQTEAGFGARNVLFLQGLATPFFRQLADKFVARGHTVHRVNFCPGDWVFGPLMGGFTGQCTSFRGRPDTLPGFYRQLFASRGIDTLLLFGDCRPVHIPAVETAHDMGIRVLCFEEGYTRPGWITLETDGTNYFSCMPKDREVLEALAGVAGITAPLPVQTIGTDMWRRSWMDVLNHALNIFGKPFYPHYRSHRPVPLSQEAKGWVNRYFRKRRNRPVNEAVLRRYEGEAGKFFLMPLQLNTDYQIRIHSRFPDMPSFIAEVMQSFAAHAEKDTRLFIKNHPLDNGLVPYRQLIGDLAAKLGIADRVDFAAGGDLNLFLAKCQGVILVNSTVGYATLLAGKPLKVLGRAIYNMPGLSDPKPLDQFWAAPQPPEHSLAQAFIGVIQTYTQLRGDFFSVQGAEIAAEATIDVLEGRKPRLERPNPSIS